MVAYGIISGISGISASSEKRKKIPFGGKNFSNDGKKREKAEKKEMPLMP